MCFRSCACILTLPLLHATAASTVFMNPAGVEGSTNADTSAEQEEDDDLYNYGPAPTSKPALIDTMVRIPIDLDGALARSKDEAADTSASASIST